jgi:hypothetical protein
MSTQFPARGRGRGAASTSSVPSDAAVLAAASHLTARDRRLVRAVAEHRVLTTSQVAALGFGSVITARHRLSVLVEIGALRRFRPHREIGSAPWHYLLGPIGAAHARSRPLPRLRPRSNDGQTIKGRVATPQRSGPDLQLRGSGGRI